jgi:V/A-type H+-transporting ATPase subunit I
LGVTPLSKVTVIAPRSDYEEVTRAIAQFEQFHSMADKESRFDPLVQELDVRAVRLFALADQTVKDLAIPLVPGTMDIVFRGVKIPRSEFEARNWDDLLRKAEAMLSPIVEETRKQMSALRQATNAETTAQTLRDAMKVVSGFSADLSNVGALHWFKVVLAVVENPTLPEFSRSLSDLVVISQTLSQSHSLVLVALPLSEADRMEKVMKAFGVEPFAIPADLPQNPAEAYSRLTQESEVASKERDAVKSEIARLRAKSETTLLAIRELAGAATEMLDEARMAGGMKRFAIISGYVPTRREKEFRERFAKWMVYGEPVGHEETIAGVPTLMENTSFMGPFQLITEAQGTPGGHEVDPTPLISFVFPIFFGMMFGDLGHGVVLTLFALLIRQRSTGNLRKWGNIFLAAGISASVFGVIFGEVFGFSLYHYVPIPPLIEIVQRPLGANPTLDPGGIEVILVIAILIGIAHITTALGLDVYQSIKGHETMELATEKLPTLAMYISGIGFGLAFVGAGYSFNVLKTSSPAPLLGLPNDILGGASLAVVFVSMVILLTGKGIAIMAGKLQGQSAGSAFANGGIDVFEKVSKFLANTISYVRLAIMLLVHASLLLVTNMLLVYPLYISAVPIVIFNILIIVFEVLIVYIQDLRLHIYEFFSKFYQGTGTPFRKIFPDRVRVRVNWL